MRAVGGYLCVVTGELLPAVDINASLASSSSRHARRTSSEPVNRSCADIMVKMRYLKPRKDSRAVGFSDSLDHGFDALAVCERIDASMAGDALGRIGGGVVSML